MTAAVMALVSIGLFALAAITLWTMRARVVPPMAGNVAVPAVIFGARHPVTLAQAYAWNSRPTSDVAAATAAQDSPVSGSASAGPSHEEGPVRQSAGRDEPAGAHASAGPYLLRLALPPLVTLIAFPSVALGPARHGISASAVVTAAAVCAAGLGLVTARAAPAPGEPDVHDRQLDVILALPLLGAAVWLALGWRGTPVADEPLGNRGVLALTVFLAGASLLLLGTRLTVRLRWVLCLPLLGLPWLGARPALRTMLIVLLMAATARVVLRHRRRTRLDQPPLRGRSPGRAQPLPRLRVSVIAIGVLALVLAGSAMAGGTVSPAPAHADQHTAHHR